MPDAPRPHGRPDGSDPDPTEASLRRALHDRAASVDPGAAPRVSALPTRRHRWPGALAAAAGVAVLAVSSALVLQGGAGPEPVAAPSSIEAPVATASGSSDDLPTTGGTTTGPSTAPSTAPTTQPSTGPTTQPTGSPSAAGSTGPGTDAGGTGDAAPPAVAPDPMTAGALAWFVREDRDGPGLVPARTAARTGGGTEARVAAAVNHLLSSPPADPEHVNGWWQPGQTAGGRVLGVDVTDDGTTLDLPAAAFDGSVGSAYANLALGALVRTAVSNGAQPPVTVLVDGRAGAEVWGVLALDGALQPDTRSLAGGWVLDPYEGQRVPAGDLTVSGTGTGSGQGLQWEVTDGTGAVVAAGTVPAGDGGYRSFSFTVELGPGRHVVAVRDPGRGRPDEGPGPVWEHTTTITVVD